MISFLRAYKRVIVGLLVVAYAAFLLIHPDEFGRINDLFFLALLVMLIASQIFWIGRILDLGERFLPGKPGRAWLAVVASLVLLFFFAYWFASSGIGHRPRPADSRLPSILIVGPFSWWLVGSWAGFGLVMAFWTGAFATSHIAGCFPGGAFGAQRPRLLARSSG